VTTGPIATPIESLERLDAHLRVRPAVAGAVALTPEALGDLGWDEALARDVMKGLGFVSARRTPPGEPSLWRRRQDGPREDGSPAGSKSPFAMLAVLQPPPRRKPRARRSKRVA
jgi:hypothetical protein